MSDERYPITWWEDTGKYSLMREGISSPILANMATGERRKYGTLPFGACYVANMDPKTKVIRPSRYVGADGLSIVCVTPRTAPADDRDKGSWHIDSRASNCTLKTDNVHRCWVRHGTVGEKLHVDKAGVTCNAGGGSIQCAGWHGYLKLGVLSRDGR